MANYYSLQQLVTDLEALAKKDPEVMVDFTFSDGYRCIDYPNANGHDITVTTESDFNMLRLTKCDPILISKLLSGIQGLIKKSKGPVLLTMSFDGIGTWPLESLATMVTAKPLKLRYCKLVHNPHQVVVKILEEAKSQSLDDVVTVLTKQYGKEPSITLYHLEDKWFTNIDSLTNAYPYLIQTSDLDSAFTKETKGAVTVMTSLLTIKELEEIFRPHNDRLKAFLAQKAKENDGSGSETTADANGNSILRKYGPGHVLLEEVSIENGDTITTKKYGPDSALQTTIYTYGDGWKKVEPYVNGKIEGSVIMYRKDGTIRSSNEFKEGKRNGVMICNYSDGKLQEKGQFVDDKEEGIWKDYDENGAIAVVTLYNKGTWEDRFYLPLETTPYHNGLLKVGDTNLLVEKISSGFLVLVGVDKNGEVETPTKEDEVRARFRGIKVIERQ